jgi:hypothetical protein
MAAVIAAIAAAVPTTCGVVIAFHPRWPRNQSVLAAYGILQLILALVMIGLGSYIADHVYGFQTEFGAIGRILYYKVMYYGGIAQSAYGAALIFIAITVAVLEKAGCRSSTRTDTWGQ